MAVYTPVSEPQLRAWLLNYGVGKLVSFRGIETGIENTNYFLSTNTADFVLTLFERLPTAHAAFYLDFMAHLARNGIAAPRPIANLNGRYLDALAGKPATLVTRLNGHSEMAPSVEHCRQVGAMLARMHLAAESFTERLDNPRGLAWWMATANKVEGFLGAAERELLCAELAFQQQHPLDALPRGVVHADLFRDNVLWSRDAISGVLDFYFAGIDSWMFDLAITANDWCMNHEPRFDVQRLHALLDGYHTLHPVSGAEQQAWPIALRAASLRFWLSRLDDFHAPRPGELTKAHDPERFRAILRYHVEEQHAWPLASAR